MKINITNDEPLTDIIRKRAIYTRIFIAFLTLGICGVLLGVYAIFSETMYYEKLETASLALFAGAALVISFTGEKLQAYRKLTPEQEKELADMAEKHPEITDYCARITKAGRKPIKAEYEACQNWAEDAKDADKLIGPKQP